MIGRLRSIFFWTGLVAALAAKGHDQQSYIDTHHAAEGQFYLLACDLDTESNLTLSWRRDDNQTLELSTSRVTIRDGSLWFLPAKQSDSGYYICEISGGRSEPRVMKMFLSVQSLPCPGHSNVNSLQIGNSGLLKCSQIHIFALDQGAQVSWLKDCDPLDWHDAKLRISNASDSNAGSYTCQINFTFEGRNYTASKTTKVKVVNDPVPMDPKVMRPRNETVQVNPGEKVELECTVLIGMSEQEVLIYWTANHSLTERYEQLHENLTYVKTDRSGVRGLSKLFISEVRPEFFHIPFHCVVTSPMGRDMGLVYLQPANHKDFHIHVVICLVLSMVVVVMVMHHLFWVDVVLVHRGLIRTFLGERAPDGKLFDAYVSYVHGNGLCPSWAEDFAVQILPEVLERRHGYRLFISGRDDLPGEVVHDVIDNIVRKSRRVIIVLSACNASGWDREGPILCRQDQGRAELEQGIALYDALIQNSLRVILVEVGKGVDYTLLPESIRYLKQKEGALRWRPSQGNPSAAPNGRFWKVLRYSMDPRIGPSPREALVL